MQGEHTAGKLAKHCARARDGPMPPKVKPFRDSPWVPETSWSTADDFSWVSWGGGIAVRSVLKRCRFEGMLYDE